LAGYHLKFSSVARNSAQAYEKKGGVRKRREVSARGASGDAQGLRSKRLVAARFDRAAADYGFQRENHELEVVY
jgi:hypothetical protein